MCGCFGVSQICTIFPMPYEHFPTMDVWGISPSFILCDFKNLHHYDLESVHVDISLSPPRQGKPSPAASQAPVGWLWGQAWNHKRLTPLWRIAKNPNAVEWKIYWSDYHNHSLLPKMWNQFLFNSDFWIPKGLWYVTKAQVDLSEFYGQPSGSPRSSNMSSFSSCVKWIGTSMITKSTRSSCLKRCRRLQGHRLRGWERRPWSDTIQKHGSIFGGPFHEPTSVGKFLWTSNSPYQA